MKTRWEDDSGRCPVVFARLAALVMLIITLWSPAQAQQPVNPPPANAAAPPAEKSPAETPAADAPAAEAPKLEEAELRFYEQEEFDEITLNDADATVIRVRPLQLESRRTAPDPSAFKKSDKLLVRRIDDPTDEYELPWREIAQVRLFEQLVLENALELVHQGKTEPARFDEAYDFFEYLKQHCPDLEGLTRAIGQYLYEEASSWHRRGNDENALALLSEIYEVDPDYPRLETALGATTEKLVEKYVARDDYPDARRLVSTLAKKYPKSASVEKLRRRWTAEANKLIAEGRRLMQDDPHQAWELALRVIYVWPTSDEAKKYFEDLNRHYPRIVVGVTSPRPVTGEPRLANWGARRSGRLLNRLLLEFAGAGSEGGRYTCPFGQVEHTDIGRRLIFRLQRGIRWSAGKGDVTGYEVARQLLTLANRHYDEFQRTWADLLGGVEVQDVYEVGVDLRWSHVQPLALLETPVVPLGARGVTGTVGPYLLGENAEGRQQFVINPAYFAKTDEQPKEIIEQYLADSKQAFSALARGRVQVVDRLNPWEVEKFRANGDFVVGEYALPTIHCLVPNANHPFMAHRAFRRALLYGINREVILRHHLLHDTNRVGCQVVSGPFPIGRSFDDPLRYAYNGQVAPRPWSPRLSMALARVALHDVSEAAKKRGEAEIKELPTLVLAHPAHDIAREACQAIQRHLQKIRFTIELRELPPGLVYPPDDNFDLFYTELAVQEPLADAGRLLGPDGIAGRSNAYLTLALAELDRATNWQEARRILQRIHQLAADDVSLLPLWQLTEHFAYHRTLK
ncbi:MAG TPA: ABC transporter substrate-binding protein, partial [Pirellulales bacterium]|nr:ABC transporter substrate-binding protein [Pirellulales bacterium]